MKILLRQQWNDIKGHVKYATVLAVGALAMAGVVALTHGLLLWQQVVLAGCFMLSVGWALYETVMASRHQLPIAPVVPPALGPGLHLGTDAELAKMARDLAEASTAITQKDESLAALSAGLKSAQMELEAGTRRLSELDNEAREQRSRSDKIWSLKRHAREVKRRWPNGDFHWYPADKSNWINPSKAPASLSDSANNREWVQDALAWHNALRAYDFRLNSDSSYLGCFEFDELMEYLDQEERAWRGISEPAKDQPFVAAEYDAGHYGFQVRNIRLCTAFDVGIVPIRLGRRRIFFPERVPILDISHAPEFLRMEARDPGRSILSLDLFEAMNEWRMESDCWEASPILLRITYRDAGLNWYMSTFFLDQDAGARESRVIACRPRPAGEQVLRWVKC